MVQIIFSVLKCKLAKIQLSSQPLMRGRSRAKSWWRPNVKMAVMSRILGSNVTKVPIIDQIDKFNVKKNEKQNKEKNTERRNQKMLEGDSEPPRIRRY